MAIDSLGGCEKRMSEEKTITKIDTMNEGLLLIILAFLIGFVGLLFSVGFTLTSFVFSEVYLIEHGISVDRFYTFMGALGEVMRWGFAILVLMFTIRCLVKPVYLVVSKRKVV